MVIQTGDSCKWTNDSQRLLLEYFDAIHNSPSQIYQFALPFSPPSWLHKCYSPWLSLEVKVIKGLPAEWGACSRTVLLGSHPQTLSYWNGTIAVGSWDGAIFIFDVITGKQTAILSGHTSWVRSVAFSSDGRSLVSGGDDATVKLWDMQTGGVIKIFHGHAGWIYSVSISADCSMVSGSSGNTIYLWDIQTEKCLWTIKQQNTVCHVGFSSINPQHIISISDKNVWQWDVNGHQIPPTYDGTYIAFSPDYTHFALCNENIVTVQKSDPRTTVAEFHVANGETRHCCFSPDGKLVAAAVDNTVYVWDITSPDPHLIETFVGHTKYISSLVFSSPSSLISVSWDKSVKFWQIGISLTDKVVTNSQSTLPSSTPIRSVSLQARAGIVISSSADEVKIWDISTGLCKASFETPLTGDQSWMKRDAKLIDGRLIFIWCTHKKINIWDIEKGECLETLTAFEEGKLSGCYGLRISGDGSKIFLHDAKCIKAWSMWKWELVGEVKVEFDWGNYMDSLCMENSRVWIHLKRSSVQEGWDFGIPGSSPVPLDPSTGRPHLDFIGSTSKWAEGPCWIKDTFTGKNVFQLSGRYAKPNDVQWDGQYLVAGYESGEVLILDFHDMNSK